MHLDRFRYLLQRLGATGIREPFQRARSWARHWNERRNVRSNPVGMSIERVYERRNRWLHEDACPDTSQTVNKSLLEALPVNWWSDRSYWDDFSRLYPEQTKRILSEAESVLAGRLRLFQWKEIELPDQVRWSATMEPGQPDEEWPQIYYADIHVYHDPVRPERDVKWCWELNRFQHLLCLGASWRLTGDECFAQQARDHLENWMDSVLYPLGVQWSSNLEVGLRLLAWARCHVLCMNSKAWHSDFTNRFITCVYIQLRHLARELTVHHSPGNHILGEASALFCASIFYPLFTASSKWRRIATNILNRLVPRIILSDGVYAEQATGYLRFVLEFLLPVLHLAKCHGIVFSEAVLQRIGSAMQFIRAIAQDSGKVPMIGDSDTGLATGWRLSDFWDFSWLTAAGGVLLDRPSLFDGIDAFPAESFLLLGESGLESFRSYKAGEHGVQATGKENPPISTFMKRASGGIQGLSEFWDFADGGYQISRDAQFSIIFDAGPLGIPPGCGHGHADGLSFLLHYKGQPVIVDTGTGLYNGPPVWRDYFRSTAAHNTISIDGKCQAVPLDTFRWVEPFKIRQKAQKNNESWRILHGTLHWGRIIHQRFIIHLLGRGLFVLDHVDGSGPHDLEWSLHFDPAWDISEIGRGLFSAWTLRHTLEVLVRYGFETGSLSNDEHDFPILSPCRRPLPSREEVRKPSRLAGEGRERGPFMSSEGPILTLGGLGGISRTIPALSQASALEAVQPGPIHTVLRGSMDPICGWYSRYYGFKIPSPTLRGKVRTQLPANVLIGIRPPGQSLELPQDLTDAIFPPGVYDFLISTAVRA